MNGYLKRKILSVVPVVRVRTGIYQKRILLMAKPFYKIIRSQETLDLLKHPYEFTLLALIAYRARRYCNLKTNGLETGEAMIGDYQTIGLSRQQYRTALKNLEKWGFLTTKSTNKGTIVKLINSTVCDINIEEANHPANQTPTIHQPSTNQQPTTNKKDKKDKKDKKEKNINIKKQFLDFVFLTDEEHKKLTAKFGNETQKWLERLNNYIGSKGKKYKSHYHTILNWSNKDAEKNIGSDQADEIKKFREELNKEVVENPYAD